MAFLENRNGKYRLKFRFKGKQYSRSLKTSNEQKALLAKGAVERNLELVALGLLQVPKNSDPTEFLTTGQFKKSDRNKPKRPKKKRNKKSPSIERLFKLYFDAFLKSSIEENSYKMLQTHRKNLERLIGKRTNASDVGSEEIQKYVDRRSKEPGRRGTVQPVTIRKEVTTLCKRS